MNYTQNYHLPQWDENDRIRRVDFNQAMECLEAGLSGEDAAIYEGLFRHACNHYHVLRSLEKLHRQVGYFHQPVSSYGLRYSGMLSRDKHIWLGNGEKAPEVAAFRDTISQNGFLDTGSTMRVYFTPDRVGRLRELTLTGSVSSSTSLGAQTIRCQVVLKNAATGEVEQTSYGNWKLPYSSTTGNFTISGLDLIVHGGQRYYMELTLETEIYMTVRVEVMPDLDYSMRFDPIQMVSASAWSSTNVGEESGGGLLLLHCKMWGEGADLTLDWDGEILKPGRVRAYSGDGANNISEIEFRRTTPVPAETSFKLNVNCRKDGEFGMYSWGFMLI